MTTDKQMVKEYKNIMPLRNWPKGGGGSIIASLYDYNWQVSMKLNYVLSNTLSS